MSQQKRMRRKRAHIEPTSHYNRFFSLKDVHPSEATTMWSITRMSSDFAAAASRHVICLSAELGVGSPEGWLCTIISALAPSSIDRRMISRGSIVTECAEPV